MTRGTGLPYCSPSRTMAYQQQVVKRRLPKSELVAAVLKRLDKPGSWTKHTEARTAGSNAVPASSLLAQSWCLRGAIYRELHDRNFEFDHLTMQLVHEIGLTFQEQFPTLRTDSYESFNDHPDVTHDDVKMVLEKVHTTLIERGE